MEFSLGAIVEALGGELIGDPGTLIRGLSTLEAADSTQISFLSNPKYGQLLLQSNAACVVVGPGAADDAQRRGSCIISDQPYVYFAKLTQFWKRACDAQLAAEPRIHPSAVVHSTAVVDSTAHIGPLCVIERGAVVGAHTVLKSRVTVGEYCKLGARCIVHAGVVIGADGFGFAPSDGAWEKIEQLGAVSIGDDVEIGANTCIDRGALQDTVLEDGVKLDNLIQIGHNVRVGKHTAMAGCVGVAGSATIGAHCTIGGGAIVLGHLRLGDHVNISAATVVSKSILKPGHYTGMFPIDENTNWERNAATLKQLHSLRDRIKTLEKEIKS